MLELFERDDDAKADLLLLDTIEVVNVRKAIEGRWTSIARQYEVGELSTIVQLYAQLGPGSFELIGRNQKGQIVRRQKQVIAPPPGEAYENIPQAAQVQPGIPSMQAQPQPDGGGNNFERQMLLGMMSQMNTMTMAFMQMASANADKHVATMTQMFTAMSTNNSSMIDRMMANTGGRDPENLFLKGVETMNELRRGAAGEPDNDAGGGAAEMLQTVAQGVQLAQSVGIFPGGPGMTPPVIPST